MSSITSLVWPYELAPPTASEPNLEPKDVAKMRIESRYHAAFPEQQPTKSLDHAWFGSRLASPGVDQIQIDSRHFLCYDLISRRSCINLPWL